MAEITKNYSDPVGPMSRCGSHATILALPEEATIVTGNEGNRAIILENKSAVW